MKILHISDLHSRPAWFQFTVEESPKYDLVCLTGDILNLGDVNPNAEEQVAAVMPYLEAIKTPLAVCSGNHDLMPDAGIGSAGWMNALRKKDVWIDGDVFWFRDYRFRCLPWGEPPPTNSKDDFWLMHEPPFGARTSTEAGGISHGCSELRDICLSGQGPLFVLSGHVHQPLGHCCMIDRTMTLNPGQGDHFVCPSHMVIDLKEHTVTHRRATLAGIKRNTYSFIN